jgi:hypothetical protein
MKILRTLLLVYAVCCAGAAPAIAQGADANTPSPEALEVAKTALGDFSRHDQ